MAARRLQHHRLVEIGVVFDLVGHDRSLGKLHRLGHQRRIEVGDADMAHLAGLPHLVQRSDLFGKRDRVVRPMQQQQVDIIGLQLFQAFIDGGEEGLVLVVLDPDLGGEKHLAACNARSSNGFADLGFVAVDLGGIDMAKTGLQRMRNDAQDIGAGNAEGAEAERRDRSAICGDIKHIFSPLRLPGLLGTWPGIL
ncbi:hypothetical protein D3C72_1029450 [compost metagenome]